MKTLKDIFKNLFAKSDCPDCGWLVACDKCSERYSAVDEDLKKKGL